MEIVTHSYNLRKKDELRSLCENKMTREFTKPITGSKDFEFAFDNSMPIDRVTSSKQVRDKFVEYNTKNPSDWELFFGFVIQETEPYFETREPRRVTFMTGDGITQFTRE